MGHKVHPIGFRLGFIRTWQSKWYATKQYRELVHEDFAIRKRVKNKAPEADVSLVEIERTASQVSVTVHTARPGIIIGRGGQRVDELRRELETLTGKKIRLNIQEIWEPELDAYLVARSIAQQLERRVAYRRAMKQTAARSMQRGAKGVMVICAGRLAGAEIARRERWHQGRVPLQTLRADIDFGIAEAHTTMGCIGVKVWVYRGDVLPEGKEAEEAAPATPAAKEAPVTPSGERQPTEKESIAADAAAKAGEASQDA